MTIDHDLNLGELLTTKEYSDQNGQLVQLNTLKGTKILLFVSMHCVRCIELLPQIRDLRLSNTNIVIFSTGDQENHRELDDFLQKKWSIVSLSPEQMEEEFEVKTHPFCIVADANGRILNRANVYSGEDVSNLASVNGEGKLKKLISHFFN
ncbi:hypothetical protein D3C76_1040420 [compost metagenome]